MCPLRLCLQWDEGSREYRQVGLLTHPDGLEIRTYHVSGQIMQSNCWGPCGNRDLAHGFDHYMTDGGTRLVCGMPAAAVARMMSIHQNCVADPLEKQRNMRLMANLLLDEALFRRSGGGVFPEY